jgi:N-methylhydantoinase B/oxoprolinase/acetone carboxylase alpha subunit
VSARQKTVIDPITLEVVGETLVSLCRGMGEAMRRTAYSPIFSEAGDFSCALFDGMGEMVAQAEYQPVHLGAMPFAVEWSLKEVGIENLEAGDVLLHNDPFRGGTHIPDYTMLLPVFVDDEIIGIPANRAHQIDVGGMAPGGFAGGATEIFQEGVRLPPVKVFSRGEEVTDIWKILLSNVRVPRDIHGDMRAMFGSLKVAEGRLLELVRKYGKATVGACMEEAKNYSERRMRAEIAELPDGRFEFEDYLDDDGVSEDDYKVRVAVTVRGTDVIIDFTGSSPQAKGNINATFGVAASMSYAAMLMLTDPHIPANHGAFRPIKLIAPPGTIVNATYPAGVYDGNTDMATRILETIIGAMAQAVPERAIAASHGTCMDIGYGGVHPDTGEYTVFYTVPHGGWGARASKDGKLVGIIAPGNAPNQPVEIFETKYPWRIEARELVGDSGGPGMYRGALGSRQVMRHLAPEGRLTILGDRFKRSPYGLLGGSPPKASDCGHWNDFRIKREGRGDFKHATELAAVPSPSKWANMLIRDGDVVEALTTGGGGYGDPLDRDPARVLADVRGGYVSLESAERDYGVTIDLDASRVDEKATERKRRLRRSLPDEANPHEL